MLGRGVTLVSAGAGVARSVERALAARDLLNQRTGQVGTAASENGWEGTYRFQCTGDPESFRELGTRFLQMPLGQVERIALPRSIVGSQR
jgi:glutamate racemase